MKLSKSSNKQSAVAQVSRAWHSLRRKVSTLKAHGNLNESKDLTKHTANQEATNAAIVPQKSRPATPHALALLNDAIFDGRPLLDPTFERDVKKAFGPEARPALELGVGIVSDARLKSPASAQPSAPSTTRPTPANTARRNPHIFSRPPSNSSMQVQLSTTTSSSKSLLSPARRPSSAIPSAEMIRRVIESTTFEEKIMHLSSAVGNLENQNLHLLKQLRYAERKVEHLQDDTFPCRRKMKVRLSGLLDEMQEKDAELGRWINRYQSVQYYDDREIRVDRQHGEAIATVQADMKQVQQLLVQMHEDLRRMEQDSSRVMVAGRKSMRQQG